MYRKVDPEGNVLGEWTRCGCSYCGSQPGQQGWHFRNEYKMIFGAPMGNCEANIRAAIGPSYTSEEGDRRCAADAGLDERATKYNFATGMWSDDDNT